jgi:hypothetical protein
VATPLAASPTHSLLLLTPFYISPTYASFHDRLNYFSRHWRQVRRHAAIQTTFEHDYSRFLKIESYLKIVIINFIQGHFAEFAVYSRFRSRHFIWAGHFDTMESACPRLHISRYHRWRQLNTVLFNYYLIPPAFAVTVSFPPLRAASSPLAIIFFDCRISTNYQVTDGHARRLSIFHGQWMVIGISALARSTLTRPHYSFSDFARQADAWKYAGAVNEPLFDSIIYATTAATLSSFHSFRAIWW